MAWHATNSYVSGSTIIDLLGSGAIDLTTTAEHEVRLFKETITGQDPDSAETYGSGAYTANGGGSGAEVADTGNYAAATPQTLTTPTLTVYQGKIVWKEADATMAWTTVTWPNGEAPQGLGVFRSTDDKLICALRFGANDVPVASGTFTVTWDTNLGLANFDYRTDI